MRAGRILTGTLILALALTGCADDDKDCVTCPEPTAEKEYHFLYNFVGDFYSSAVLTYSTKTGEVVDSAYYGRFPFWDVKFTSDGRYACYTSADAGFATTWITEYATGDTVSVLQGVAGVWLSISHDDQFLLLSASYAAPSRVMLFRIPSLEIVYESAEGSWAHGDLHPTENLAVIPKYDEDSLLVIDFRSDEILLRKSAIRLLSGQSMRSVKVTFVQNSDKLLVVGGPLSQPQTGRYTQIRDASSLELLEEFANPIRVGPYVHPDGDRAYFLDPWRDLYAYPSSLWELNLHTLVLRKIIDGRNFIGPSPYFPAFNPSDMDFTPDGRYAIFISGGEGMEHGPILKMDLETYEIVDTFDAPGGVARSLRMYPIEMQK